ncbi:MAG TPA: metallophosphoesterase [Ktedonobacteraceae bacterium]|nr:metallophosphoesterase [Ktedonobacteraceae bacterium]
MSEQNVEEGSISNSAPVSNEQANGVITIVLTADNHLGYAASGQGPRKREEHRQRLRHAFQQATDFAIGQGVDLFIQAGDLFNTISPDEQDRSFVATRLAQLRQLGIRTFALGGIHDTPADGRSALAPQMSYARLGALHYFPPRTFSAGGVSAGEPLEPVIVDVRGTLVGICGLSVLAGQEGDPLEQLRVESDIERAVISLLLLHAPIEGLAADRALLETRAQVSRASIEQQSEFRYILAGYHHGYRRFQAGATEVVVAGATQHVDFNNPTDDPGFVFLGLAADGVRWCKHIGVDALHLQRLVIRMADLWPEGEDEQRIVSTDAILERLRPVCSGDTLVQLRFEGAVTRNQYHQLDLNQVRRFGEEHCFALSIDDSALSFLPEQQAVSAETGERFSPREELVALADEWVAAAESEQERQALLITKEELLAALDGVRYPASRNGLLH